MTKPWDGTETVENGMVAQPIGEAELPTGYVTVEFLQPYDIYARGDVVALDPNFAKWLREKKFARKYDPENKALAPKPATQWVGTTEHRVV